MWFSISLIYNKKNTRKLRPPPLLANHSKREIFSAAQISNNYVGAITVLYWKQKEYAKLFLSLHFCMFIFWDYICFSFDRKQYIGLSVGVAGRFIEHR